MMIGISIPTTRTLEQEYHANKMKLFLQPAKKTSKKSAEKTTKRKRRNERARRNLFESRASPKKGFFYRCVKRGHENVSDSVSDSKIELKSTL